MLYWQETLKKERLKVKEIVIDKNKKVYFNALVYGPPKSGKSWFCSTMPSPYIICSDRPPTFLSVSQKIQGVIVETFDEADAVLREIVLGKRALGCRSIIVDGLSDMTPLAIDKAMQAKPGRKSLLLTIDEWGLVSSYLRTFVRYFSREVGRNHHVCMTARTSLIQDKLTGKVIGVPETVGKFSEDVGGFFDALLFCKEETVGGKTSWNLHTKTTDIWYGAGDALGGFMQEIEPNNFSIVYEKIREGAIKKGADPNVYA